MKKISYLILSVILFIPFIVNAETITYNVCETCEYTDLSTVKNNIDSLSDLTDKDIKININSDYSNHYSFIFREDTVPKSITIDGNNHNINYNFAFNNINNINIRNINNLSSIMINKAQNVAISNINEISSDVDLNDVQNTEISHISNVNRIVTTNLQKLKIINTTIKKDIELSYLDESSQVSNEIIDFNDVLEIDEETLNNMFSIYLAGNIQMRNIDIHKQVIVPFAGDINIYNSKVGKIVNYPIVGNTLVNIYNSNFNSLKYTNIDSIEDDSLNDFQQFMSNYEQDVLNYDIYDVDSTSMGGSTKSNTMVYFDKETKLKPDDKLDLSSYLDYYTEDKEIEYTIEDESIAKIENKELIGLKEGNTKVTVTTDEGHVVYNINLVVEKETIPEKIDKMTIKVPITGSKIKAWVVVISTLLLAVIGGCIYMLVKKKKEKI